MGTQSNKQTTKSCVETELNFTSGLICVSNSREIHAIVLLLTTHFAEFQCSYN